MLDGKNFRRRCGNCSVDGNSAGIKHVDEFSNMTALMIRSGFETCAEI